MGREFRVVSALHGTAVPMARTGALCDDPSDIGVPFSIVEYVEGRVVCTCADAGGLGREALERCALGLVDALDALHADVGLAGFGKPDGYVERLRRTAGPALARPVGRHVRGLTVGTGFDTVGSAVPGLVAAGLRALPGPAGGWRSGQG
jgi:hypothetical protein